MKLYVLDENVMRKYTDDENLIVLIDLFLRYFTTIENMDEFMAYPIEYFVNVPEMTIEMCQLIYKVKNEEYKHEYC